MKEMVLSIGGILGPLTAVLMTDRVAPQLILVAGTVLLVLSGSAIGILALRGGVIRRR
jgi:hypothetical protein